METRVLGRTGREVSAVGLDAWQIGGDWGTVGDDEALDVLRAAVDSGATFIDTADVYGDGRSERLVGRLLQQVGDVGLTVATKAGRRADPHVPEAYTLVEEGCVAAYGVSVETVAEALRAMQRPGVATLQIKQTTFAPDDHRSFNRHGEAFDVGETFAGVPFEVGVEAARELAAGLLGEGTTAQKALRWILDQEGVSTVIPGARSADQARGNAAAAELSPITEERGHVADVYTRLVAPHVHARW